MEGKVKKKVNEKEERGGKMGEGNGGEIEGKN